jgi:hypothetical protein
MDKPWWLRLTGVVTLGSATLLGVGVALSPGFFMKPWMLAIFLAWATITIGLFMVWASIFGMIWVAHRTGRTQAAITFEVLAELFKKMESQLTTPTESPETNAWDNASTGIICDGCKRPHAMLYCKRHKVTLCVQCTRRHDAENCLYIPADRHAGGPQKQTVEAKAMGKVLGI